MSCKNCKCISCADGSGSPALSSIADFGKYINDNIFDGKATVAQIKDAYPKVMVYLDSKKLPKTEQSIKDNASEIKKAIDNPDFLKEKPDNTDYKKIGITILVGVAILFILTKLK